MQIKKYAIIVAGGSGNRMQQTVPKQFLPLNGKPVISYSIEAFHAFDKDIEIILVIHPDYISLWQSLCAEFDIKIDFRVVIGGQTRFESVKNGLQSIDGEGYVAIHDAARPVIDATFVKQVFDQAEKYGSAMPGIGLNDTIRMIDGNSSVQLDRTLLRSMQTPQVFQIHELRKAYEQEFQPFFTDDASVMQSAGFALHMVEGRQGNIKITHPQDMVVAEALLKMQYPEKS